jgi:hypothetical protein
MNTVSITGTIAVRTIGEGWKDKIQAAHTYAGFLHRQIAGTCKQNDMPAKVMILVSEDADKTTFQFDGDQAAKMSAEAIVATDEATAWEKFITSEEAGYLALEVQAA